MIDAQNGILTDALVEDAADRVVNVYNGYIDRIVSCTGCVQQLCEEIP